MVIIIMLKFHSHQTQLHQTNLNLTDVILEKVRFYANLFLDILKKFHNFGFKLADRTLLKFVHDPDENEHIVCSLLGAVAYGMRQGEAIS